MSSPNTTRRVSIYINGKEVNNDIRSIKAEWSKLNNEVARMHRDSAEYERAVKDLARTSRILKQHQDDIKGVGSAWGAVKKEVFTITTGVTGGLLVQKALEKVTDFIPQMKKRLADLSDELTNIEKTTSIAGEGLEYLNSQLIKMNVRTPVSELRKLAAEAGKVGVKGTRNILDFVEGANQVKVALGEDLGEDAIIHLGKLNSLFKLNDLLGYKNAMLATGSAINELGAASEAKESYIVGFGNRLGGIAAKAKIAITEIFGLGALLDSLGQTEETSATAVGTFLTDMFIDTATYANIAKMSMTDFTNLLNTDANEAFIKVLEGLNGNNDGFAALALKLKEAGVEGSRAVQILSTLAGNTQKLREQQDLSAKSFKEATSLTAEFNKKNENLAGQMEQVDMWFSKVFGTKGRGLVEGFYSMMYKYIKIPVAQKLQEESSRLNALVSSIAIANNNQEVRNRLIETLKNEYPEFIKMIDIEKASIDELKEAIKLSNEEYRKKIILAKNQDRENSYLKAKEDLISKIVNAEMKLASIDKNFKIGDNVEEKYRVQMANSPTIRKRFGTLKVVDEILTLKSSLASLDKIYERFSKERTQIENAFAPIGPMPLDPNFLNKPDPTSSPTPITKIDDSEAKKIKKANDDLIWAIREARVEAIEDDKTRELEAAWLKYQRAKKSTEELVAEEKLKNERLRLLKEELKASEAAIEEKYNKKAIEDGRSAEEEYGKMLRAKADQQQNRKMAGLEERLFSTSDTDLDTRMTLQLEMLQSQFEYEMQFLQDGSAEKLRLETEYYQNRERIATEYADKKIAIADNEAKKEMSIFDAKMRFISDMTRVVGNALMQSTQSDMMTLQQKQQAYYKDLEERRERGLITQEQFNRDKERAEQANAKKAAALRRKQFMIEKGIALSEIIINMAIAKAKGAKAEPGPPWSLLVNIPPLIGLGISLANQVSSSEVPQMYAGGYFDVLGQQDKKNYMAKYVGRRNTGMLPSQPNLVLASEKGPEYFVANEDLNNPQVAAHVSAIEAIRQNRQSGSNANTQTMLDGNINNALLQDMLIEFRQLKAYMADPGNRKAQVNYDLIKQREDDITFVYQLGKIN